MSNQRFAGLEAVISEDVLSLLRDRGRRGATGDEIRRRLAQAWSADDLAQALAALQADGSVLSWRDRWYLPRFTDWEVGTVQLLERGDGLIRSGAGGEVGYFVRQRDLKGAADQDTVLVRRRKAKRRRGLESRLPEATVVRVVARRRGTVVGTLQGEGDRRRLLPFDPKLRLDVEVSGAESLDDLQYVVVEILAPGRAARGPSRGRVVEVLGDPEVPGVDVNVVLRHFEIPEEFPADAAAEAATLPTEPSAQDVAARVDLRAHTVITIDGETARDFDDAISVERLADGRYLLGVHIADVAHYVAPGSPLDHEAYRRGTSVYYPERAVPMLPERLSNELCSLRPAVPRLTLSAWLTIDRRGVVQQRRFAETVIRSARRMTYAEVRRLLDEPRDTDAADYGPVLELLHTARELMGKLLQQRTERGSIDFDLPEGDVILDREGFTVGVRPGARTVAHRIIEEFMIAANEAVAAELEGHQLPALFRVHEPPSPSDLEELRQLLAGLGIGLEGNLEALHPNVLQQLLQRVEGRPEEPFVAFMVLRAMQRAVYHPECRGHYALSSRHYLHFTSPIRRYPDLVVHRQLKRLLAGQEPPPQDLLARALPAMAEHCSHTERRAEQSERLLLQWKLVRFLSGRIGDTFSGRITGVQPFGLFVQLSEYFVDGLVPWRELDDDYRFEAETHQLVSLSGRRRLRLADAVEVVLVGVDPRRRSLDLRLSS